MNDTGLNINPELKQCISSLQARKFRIIARELSDEVLKLYIDENRNVNGIQKELEVITGKNIELFPVDPGFLDQALSRYYPETGPGLKTRNLNSLFGNKEKMVEELISEASTASCSDIHFEAREKNCRIRFRIDGQLVDRYILPVKEYPSLINAVKIKASLDIAEKRLPQDGRIMFNRDGVKVDLRVSVIPTINGEKIVLRILNKDSSHLDLKNIGFSDEQLRDYLKGIYSSHGIVLISGPTGSGKTTTLYATLKKLNTKEKNILTIEDPIEYTLEGINQVQLKEDIGLSFPVALRTFLRQDPDIIMVGEIRDPETAQIAIRSALTGHLVLSTIHTNSAVGVVSRLTDMGVPDYLISATLNVSVAQRLVRLLCPSCKKESEDYNPLLDSFFSDRNFPVYQPQGCETCNYSGFKGRKAIFEVIPIDEKIKNLIKNNSLSAEKLPEGFSLISFQARRLFSEGQTSFEEILPMILNV